MTVNGLEVCVDASVQSELPVEVADELMPEHVEIDPVGGAAALGATEHAGIEAPRLLQVPDLDGDMKRGEDSAAHPGRIADASLRRRRVPAPAVKSTKNDLEDVEASLQPLRLQDAAEV